MIGTDYPFRGPSTEVDLVLSTPGLSDDQRIAILGDRGPPDGDRLIACDLTAEWPWFGRTRTIDHDPSPVATFDRLRQRIQALRAKTVANGCTEGEALAAAAKVAELLDRYDLSLYRRRDPQIVLRAASSTRFAVTSVFRSTSASA